MTASVAAGGVSVLCGALVSVIDGEVADDIVVDAFWQDVEIKMAARINAVH